VQAEQGVPGSTLELYRSALRLRHGMPAADRVEWVEHPGADVLHFRRPGDWHSITNFGDVAVELPPGEVLLSSSPIVHGMLPPDSTAWLSTDGSD
jgi:alpha-glucosidase